MPSASIVTSRTWVVQNLHQEVRMQNNKESRIVLQRKLRFEEEEIWTELSRWTEIPDGRLRVFKDLSRFKTNIIAF
jgi:hypothetical protein